MNYKIFNIWKILIFTIFPFVQLSAHAVTNCGLKEQPVSVVVIDPGHGGIDLGATVGNTYEKDIALEIALILGELINNNFPDIKIIYTRDTDVFIPVYERARIANQNKADLFISVHVNAVEQTYVSGAETYVLGQHSTGENFEVAKKENSVILLEDDYNTTYEGFNPESPESYIMFELVQNEYLEQSVLFASKIQNQFEMFANRENRSVKQSGFIVLRQITMPGVLIEVGFLSNPNERQYMSSIKGKTEIAMSVYKAFKEYKKQIDEKSIFMVKAENVDNKDEADSLANLNQQRLAKNDTDNNIYYSVQILESKRKIKTKPSKFKGEQHIVRKDDKKLSRYFSGRFYSYEEALIEKERIKQKYDEAFVVKFENGELISVKKELNK